MKAAIFAGSFDPWHHGHQQILVKALKIFDFVYVVVANNVDKDNAVTLKTRALETSAQLQDMKNVKVITTEKLVVDTARELGVNFLVRGARNAKDYEYELDIAAVNKHLWSEIETIIIIPNYDDINISSSLLKIK